MKRSRARYGETYVMRLAGAGNIVLLSNPEHIKRVFTGDPDLMRAGEVNTIIGPIVGQHSVLVLDGVRHLRHRRLMLPPFHGERMRLYAASMQAITEANLETWPDGSPFPLRREMQWITLEVIMRTVFGVERGSALSELRARLERLLSIADSPSAVIGLIPMFRVDLPFSPWRRVVRYRDSADRAIFAVISERRRAPRGDDVLSLLLDAVDEDGQKLDDRELRDELMTLLLAGHETTATAISWTVERVLAHPPVLERLLAELEDVIGDSRLSPEHFSRLEYLDATIKEALRLRPVIPMVGRRLHAPLALGDFEVPKGWVVAPSIYLTHTNPKNYPDPEAFHPERFLGARVDPYSWLPFGGGIRRCLGMAFALYEMKVVIATILANMRLELAQPAPVRMVRRAITFSPERGTLVRARRNGVEPVVPMRRTTGSRGLARR